MDHNKKWQAATGQKNQERRWDQKEESAKKEAFDTWRDSSPNYM
jgi:hypothetical protein